MTDSVPRADRASHQPVVVHSRALTCLTDAKHSMTLWPESTRTLVRKRCKVGSTQNGLIIITLLLFVTGPDVPSSGLGFVFVGYRFIAQYFVYLFYCRPVSYRGDATTPLQRRR
jgi:hypothetical protein